MGPHHLQNKCIPYLFGEKHVCFLCKANSRQSEAMTLQFSLAMGAGAGLGASTDTAFPADEKEASDRMCMRAS